MCIRDRLSSTSRPPGLRGRPGSRPAPAFARLRSHTPQLPTGVRETGTDCHDAALRSHQREVRPLMDAPASSFDRVQQHSTLVSLYVQSLPGTYLAAFRQGWENQNFEGSRRYLRTVFLRSHHWQACRGTLTRSTKFLDARFDDAFDPMNAPVGRSLGWMWCRRDERKASPARTQPARIAALFGRVR